MRREIAVIHHRQPHNSGTLTPRYGVPSWRKGRGGTGGMGGVHGRIHGRVPASSAATMAAVTRSYTSTFGVAVWVVIVILLVRFGSIPREGRAAWRGRAALQGGEGMPFQDTLGRSRWGRRVTARRAAARQGATGSRSPKGPGKGIAA